MSYMRSSSSSGGGSHGGGVPASRSVALDLMLRSFMNSSEFHSHPKVWENISKLVPGTTPQQCCERWGELCNLSGGSVAGDYSELSAHGRPLSYTQSRHHTAKFVRSALSSTSSQNSTSSRPSPADITLLRPHSHSEGVFPHRTGERERWPSLPRRERDGHRKMAGYGGGMFVANFYQNMMNKEQQQEEGAKREGREETERREVQNKESGFDKGRGGSGRRGRGEQGTLVDKKEEVINKERSDQGIEHVRSTATQASLETSIKEHHKDSSTAPCDADMIIHVFDEQRKSKREFHCPRGVLVKEMQYFSEYLSSDTQLLDEVDISVHCDIPVFEWLMRYAKRGLFEGPQGEILESPLKPPKLEPEAVVSILISSNFLKMNSLVEKCLDFCHDNCSAVLASPTNMSCISDRLRERLAARFTPTEIEAIIDKKDKMRSKLFTHQIQQLFSPTYDHTESPASAATLHRCKHCGKLLTSELCTLLPCTTSRLEVHRRGQVVYSHERDEGWNVTSYLSSLQHSLTPREIYWRLWGVVNWMKCSVCGQVFQCCELASCHYHPQPALSGHTSTGPPVHICCGSPPADLSPFPLPHNGCCVRDHTVADPPPSPSPSLLSLLLAHRDVIRSNEGTSPKKASIKNSSPSVNSAQLNYLKNVDLLRSTSALCIEPSSQPKGGRSGESVRSREGDTGAREQGNGAVTMEMSLSTRQRVLSELSELEEDEEVVERPPLPRLPLPPSGNSAATAPRHVYKRDSSKSHRSTLRRKHSSAPAVAVEWVWDSSKPQRWNQDRQRESDERRLSAMCDQMSVTPSSASSTLHTSTKFPTHTSTKFPSKPPEKDSTCYAGGIFAVLEAQFRAQLSERVLTQQPQPHTTGTRFWGRKR